ncbi:hypothetical protein HZC53_00285 [Candidatus Uhrbacteria bacterium]|nr:hypothetical protein [Candidatus Uhrbacteria bacterium]
MSFETLSDLKELPVSHAEREAQKERELQLLEQDRTKAVAEFASQREAREARRAKAFGVVVGCMDERNTFQNEATGEPLGAVESFSSPGGRVTAETLLKLYGPQIEEARKSGKEINIYLFPHKCSGDGHAGCAAFKNDEAALTEYFSNLATDLKSRPEFAGANFVTAFYDTDDHGLEPIGDSIIPAAADYARNRLVESVGISKADGVGPKDRVHSGNRIYVGELPRAWSATRNAAYNLHPGMPVEELLEGVALAVRVIKTHSHVKLREKPVVIQLDSPVGSEDPIQMTDEKILERLNASPLLKGIELTADELLVVRSETDKESWQGSISSLSVEK